MRIDDKILGVKGLGILMLVQQPWADNFFYSHWLCTGTYKDFIHQGLHNSQKNCNSLHYLKFIRKEHYPINLNTPTAFFKAHYALNQWILGGGGVGNFGIFFLNQQIVHRTRSWRNDTWVSYISIQMEKDTIPLRKLYVMAHYTWNVEM